MSQSWVPEDVASASSFGVRLVNWISWLSGALSSLLIFVTLTISVYAIFQRYIIDRPLLWGDELLGYLLVALVMFGAAEALRGNHHIAIDLLYSRTRSRARFALKMLSDAAVLAFAIILGVSTWDSISFAYGFGSYSPGYIEIGTWIPQVPMLIGCVLLGLVAATRVASGFIERNKP